MNILQTEQNNRGRFYTEDNLAEMIYHTESKKLIIEHTHVDGSLAGKGVGRQIVAFAVNYARNNGFHIIPVCTFAQAVFKKTPEYSDVLHASEKL